MSISVFLADDHTVVRDGLRALLEAQPNIEVVGDAANGLEAVRLVIQLHPDVVVMDIAMPGLNGIDATHEIIQACPGTRVIILSMYATAEHITRALQAGAWGYLLKESAGSEVVEAIRVIQGNQHYLSQKIVDKLIDLYRNQRLPTEIQNPLDSLSPREREVLQLVVEGKSSSDIARILSLSIKTVETYRSRLMMKLDITNIPDLVKFAIQQGLIQLD